MALAHVVGDKVEAAYRRGDLFGKRIALMADWAIFCGSGADSILTSESPIHLGFALPIPGFRGGSFTYLLGII